MPKTTVHSYTVVITRDKDGMLMGSVPELPGCHTQGKNYNTVMDRIQEAIELYLDVEKENMRSLPQEEFIGLQQIKISVNA